MAQQLVRNIMTPSPFTIDAGETVGAAARLMEANDIGDVIVTRDGKTFGIVTDRDIVVRAVAQGLDPDTRVEEICSAELTTIGEGASASDAADLMRDRAIRRLPVVDDGKPVGIVTLGDLAEERDPESALADISAAPPNR